MLSIERPARGLRCRSVAHGPLNGPQRRLPGGHRLFDVAMAHSIAEHAAWIAVLVVAFERGGADASAVVVAVQLVPAALVAPVVASAGDRFPRHVVLRIALATLTVAALAIAVSLRLGAPIAVTYVLAAIFTIGLSATPATLASMLVHHAVSPAQLTRWNAATAVVRWGGSLLGPLLIALVLTVSGPPAAFVTIAAACAIALVVGWTVPADDRAATRLRLDDVARDSWQGVRYALGHRETRRTVGFLTLTQVLVGGLDVVFLVVAFDRLGRSGGAAALIAAGFSVGGVAVSLLAVRHAHRSPLVLVVAGAFLLTLPVVVLGEVTSLAAALVPVAALGAGNALTEIGGHTLLQRVTPETMTSRVVGLLDSTSMAGAAIGALVAGTLFAGSEHGGAFVALGTLGLIVLLAAATTLVTVQRRAAPVDPERVEALWRVPFFTPLPLPTLERLGEAMDCRRVVAGETLIAEGATGREFYVLLEGTVEVSAGEGTITTLRSPSYFGEVALIRDTVRNASVVVVTDGAVGVIDRAAFLDAVALTPSSRAAARDVSRRRSRDRTTR